VTSLAVKTADLLRVDLRARLPFKYGIVTMVHVPHVFLRLQVETPAGVFQGIAADHLPPKWFTKDPTRDVASEIEDMLAVVTHAATAAMKISAFTAFRFWLELKTVQAEWGAKHGHPPLLAQFGTSLVERALLDALARSQATTLRGLLHNGSLGIELGEVHPELRGVDPAALLPASPPQAIVCRHTVGMVDPLFESEIGAEARLDDGLPQSLEASIDVYGLRHFKLKIDGNHPDAALARLRAILGLIGPRAGQDYAFTVDGNESFSTAGAFRDFWARVEADPVLQPTLSHLLFVEQPLARAVALDPARADLGDWPARPPIIIDESDAEPADLRRALELGYAGTSHKNCKGIFKGVAHACLIRRRNLTGSAPLLQSGEDLANVGPVALPQDLAAQAVLGITSVERNGHHYFAGLSPWPVEVQEAMLAAHPDLYGRSARGWPTLRVEKGLISTRSVLAAPFGVGADLPLERIPGVWTHLA